MKFMRAIYLNEEEKPVINMENVKIGQFFIVEEYPNTLFIRLDEKRVFGMNGFMYQIEKEE